MTDAFLLEAMREVDAMLPGTPPIAPELPPLPVPIPPREKSHREIVMEAYGARFDFPLQRWVLANGSTVAVTAYHRTHEDINNADWEAVVSAAREAHWSLDPLNHAGT